MTRSVFQPLRSRRMTRSASRLQHNTLRSKGPTLTPATRKTLATIGALWVSFAVTASATASPVTEAATAANPAAAAQAKMVTVSPSSGDPDERGRDAIPRSESAVRNRSDFGPGSADPSGSESQPSPFVSTGKRPEGSAPRSPAADHRQKKDDATAVIAYLILLSK